MKTINGQAALSLVFVVGSIVLAVGVTVALLAFTSLNSGFGFESSQRLFAAAQSGTDDALMQLVRDKSFASSGYQVALSGATATVTVTQGSPAAGKATIVSTATRTFRTRSLTTIVSVNAETGALTLLSSQ